jgi:molybdopterin converting factor small subunit
MSQHSAAESGVNIDVKFFASLREQVGVAELQINATNLAALLKELKTQLSPNIRLAVNQNLVEGDWREAALVFAAGDEVAFLPPVTGG